MPWKIFVCFKVCIVKVLYIRIRNVLQRVCLYFNEENVRLRDAPLCSP